MEQSGIRVGKQAKGDRRDFCLCAKRTRCSRGWLWWCGLFTNMIYDVLPRRASARDSQCAHNVRHNLLILLMAPAHYYWFRTAPRSDGRWFIPVVIGPMLNRPRTRSRENTIRRLVYFSFPIARLFYSCRYSYRCEWISVVQAVQSPPVFVRRLAACKRKKENSFISYVSSPACHR